MSVQREDHKHFTAIAARKWPAWKYMLEGYAGMCSAASHLDIGLCRCRGGGCVYCYSLKCSTTLVGRAYLVLAVLGLANITVIVVVVVVIVLLSRAFWCFAVASFAPSVRLQVFSSTPGVHYINLSFQKSVSKRGAFWYRLLVCCRFASACMRSLGSMLGPRRTCSTQTPVWHAWFKKIMPKKDILDMGRDHFLSRIRDFWHT